MDIQQQLVSYFGAQQKREERKTDGRQVTEALLIEQVTMSVAQFCFSVVFFLLGIGLLCTGTKTVLLERHGDDVHLVIETNRLFWSARAFYPAKELTSIGWSNISAKTARYPRYQVTLAAASTNSTLSLPLLYPGRKSAHQVSQHIIRVFHQMQINLNYDNDPHKE